MGNVNLPIFKEELQEIVDNTDINRDNFKSKFNYYKLSSERLMNKHAPQKTRRVNIQQKPRWLDDEFRRCRAERRKLERKWRRNKTEDNHRRYVDQRNLCAQMSINKQRLYYSKMIEESSGKQKSLFKVVNELWDKKNMVLPSHHEFNDFYIHKIEKLRESIISTEESVLMNNEYEYNGYLLDSFEPTTDDEIKELIKEFGIKTSCEDPIPAKVLQSIIDIALPCLTKLINQSLIEGSMEGVKHSVIDPLLKSSGLDSDAKKNYRPVNNLVFFSKLIERVVLKRLNNHMTNNGLHKDNNLDIKNIIAPRQ